LLDDLLLVELEVLFLVTLEFPVLLVLLVVLLEVVEELPEDLLPVELVLLLEDLLVELLVEEFVLFPDFDAFVEELVEEFFLVLEFDDALVLFDEPEEFEVELEVLFFVELDLFSPSSSRLTRSSSSKEVSLSSRWSFLSAKLITY
jgi:hypothetical protein